MTWREHAAAIITGVIDEHYEESEKQIRAALRDAYPYGERKLWPYKVWCSEVRRQLGIKAKAAGARCYQEHLKAGQIELALVTTSEKIPSSGDTAGVGTK